MNNISTAFINHKGIVCPKMKSFSSVKHKKKEYIFATVGNQTVDGSL